MRSMRSSGNRGLDAQSGQASPFFILGTAVFFLVIFAILGVAGCNSIAPGNIGIVVSKTGSSRGVQDIGIRTGYAWVNPITHEVIEYPFSMQTVSWTKSENEGKPVDESITFTTQDSMIVNADVSMSYYLNPDMVPAFYVRFRADKISDFTDAYLRNMVRNAFNDHAGKFGVEQVMGDNGKLLADVKKEINDQLELKYGVHVDQLGFIGAPRPPGMVMDRINSKVAAVQQALQSENEIKMADFNTRKNVISAENNAKAHIAQAEGEAKANQIMTSSITPQLIEWRKLEIQSRAVEKWNGVRPHVEAGTGNGFMIDTK